MTNEEQQAIEQHNKALQQISREQHGHRAYAQARFDLGKNYYQLGNVEKAILTLQSIQAKDYPELYAHAQFNIGNYYQELGYSENAIQMWQHIQPSHGELYAYTQLSLGKAYQQLQQYHKAIESWQHIKYKDGKDLYINALYSIATAYIALNDIEQAILTWQNVMVYQQDDADLMATACFNLGNLYDDLKQREYAIRTWQQIPSGHALYASSQFNIGNAYMTLNQVEYAIQSWQNIQPEHGDLYQYVQQQIHAIRTAQQQQQAQNELETANQSPEHNTSEVTQTEIENLPSEQYSPASTSKQITQLEPLQQAYTLLQQQIQTLQDLLRLDIHHRIEEQVFLQIPTNEFIPQLEKTAFQLNTLQQQPNIIQHSALLEFLGLNAISSYHTLLANQGLIFIQPLQINISRENPKHIYAELHAPLLQQNLDEGIQGILSEDFILYRSIYLDPTTDYIQLAQRDKLSYYQQWAKQKSRDEIEQEWQAYQAEITEKEQKVYVLLQQLKQNVQQIFATHPHQDAIQLLNQQLSPLIALIQHAGQTPHQCHLCYITNWDNVLIQRDETSTDLFVEASIGLAKSLRAVHLPQQAQAIYPFMLNLFEGQTQRVHFLE